MQKPKGFADSATPSRTRRATNISLDSALLSEAKALEVNISRACERGLALEVAAAREKRWRSEEHTSELQSLMSISYAVFCLKKKKNKIYKQNNTMNKLKTHSVDKTQDK